MLRHGLSLLLLTGLTQAQLVINKRSEPQAILKADYQAASADFSQGQYSVIKQDESICQSYGENQWTGTVDVTDERRLFFWFFESRNDPKNDPVVLWMNGGPGGSSMMGLFTEMGPCILPVESNYTYANEYSWNNNASLLFIDQPAGVGFASLAKGAPVPNGDMDGAYDFQFFLNKFFYEIFPEYSKNPIHIAGESYGGHYVPTYVNHILESRKHNSRDAFMGNISSLILVDAVINFPALGLGFYTLLCNPLKPEFNSSNCDDMASYIPECMKMETYCSLTYDGEMCRKAMFYCEENVGKHYNMEVEQGLRQPYNIHKPCESLPFCDDTTIGNFTKYLNQPSFISKLGFAKDFTFSSINLEVNTAYTDRNDPFLPTTRYVSNILESKDDISILVLNGNDDFIVNSAGQIWAYEHLAWSGLAKFNVDTWKDYYAPSNTEKRAGDYKQTPDGHLVFATLDDAGHTCPGDQKEAASLVFEKWISGWNEGI